MAAPYPSNAIDAFKKALDLHNNNEFKEAVAQYDKVITLHKAFIEGLKAYLIFRNC